MKIAYVTSEGGHLTELLYLSSGIKDDDHFFITFDSPRARVLPTKKYLVPDFWTSPRKIFSALIAIMKILVREKPDIMVSTGSEIAIPFFFMAKLLGIRTVFIECYTRIEEPTITGRIVYPVSDIFLVNWEELLPSYGRKAEHWGALFRPRRMRAEDRHQAKDQILALVGMNFRNFDRLLKVMDDVAAHTNDRVIIQLGTSHFKPVHAESFDFKPYSTVLQMIKESRALVCQGAMSAVDGLVNGCDVIVIPRSSKLGEVINDHQIIFSERLASMGLLRTAYDIEKVEECLRVHADPDRDILELNLEMVNKLSDRLQSLK